MSIGTDGIIRPRILIVDDSLDNSELLQIMLNWEGFVTSAVGSGEEALASVQSDGRIEVTCEFCNTRYHFDAVDVEQIFLDPAVVGQGPVPCFVLS